MGYRSWNYTCDANGKQTSQSDPMGNQTTFSYSAVNGLNAAIETDPNGNTQVFAYDSGRRLTLTEDAEGYPTQRVYDNDNNARQITDRRNNVWKYTYDPNGNLLTALDPYNAQQNNLPTVYTYTPHNHLASVMDANSHTTTFTYDAQDNNLVKITDARHYDTTLTPGAFGLLAKRLDANQNLTTYLYDANGELKSVLDANNHPTIYQPNALGWTLSTTEANQHTTNYKYDNWGRFLTEIDPQDPNATYTETDNVYDPNDNLLSVTDSNFNETDYAYDDADRQTTETRANGDVITYGYDADGQKGRVSYKLLGNGAYTAYAYTPRGEVSAMSDAIGTRDIWTYDPNGNLASHTDPNGVTTAYAYYVHNLLQSINYPTNPQVSFTYDPAGRKIGMTDATGPTTYGYDDANNLTLIAAPNGSTGYHYDPANRQDTMTLALTGGTGNGTYTYGYDKADNQTSIINPFNERTSFIYDAGDRLVKQVRGSGAATVVEETIYDTQDRVLSLITYTGSGNYNGSGDYVDDGDTDGAAVHRPDPSYLLQEFDYTYDAAGNIQTRSDSGLNVSPLNVTYTYDNYDQLTSETATDRNSNIFYSRAFTYDHAGNRLTATHSDGGAPAVTDTYTYLPNSNRLQSAGNRAYTYDSAGNIKTLSINGVLTQSFTYDEENRVGAINYPALPANPASSFQYNGLRLRVGKKDNSGAVSHYVTDGDSPGADVLSDGQAIYTPGLSERRGSATSFVSLDALGNLRSRGSVNAALRFDAFGQALSPAAATPLSFGFEADAQYQTDADSGLTLIGNRYYDAVIGRFVQPDPSAQEDNEYAYAENNPISNDDPDGLQTQGAKPKPTGSGPQHNKKKKGTKKGNARAGRAKKVANNYDAYEHINQTDCGRFVQHVVGYDDIHYPTVRVTLQRAYVRAHPDE